MQWGPLVTFGIGSGVLLGAAAILRAVRPQALLAATKDREAHSSLSWSRLAWVFGAGVGVAIGFRSMMQAFPKILEAQVAQAPANLILGCIFIAVAVTAIPAGTLALRWGQWRSLLLGLGAMAGGLMVMPGVQSAGSAALLAIGLGASFSLVSNGTIPLALSVVPPSKAGLGTGMFFSGGAIGLSLFFGVFTQIAPTIGCWVGAGAFLAAGLCALATSNLKPE